MESHFYEIILLRFHKSIAFLSTSICISLHRQKKKRVLHYKNEN